MWNAERSSEQTSLLSHFILLTYHSQPQHLDWFLCDCVSSYVTICMGGVHDAWLSVNNNCTLSVRRFFIVRCSYSVGMFLHNGPNLLLASTTNPTIQRILLVCHAKLISSHPKFIGTSTSSSRNLCPTL